MDYFVHDRHASAENTFKALNGKRICGASYSVIVYRQPLPMLKFARVGKKYELP